MNKKMGQELTSKRGDPSLQGEKYDDGLLHDFVSNIYIIIM